MKLSQTMRKVVDLLESKGVERRQYRRTLESITGVSYSGVSQWFSGDTKQINYLHLKAIADHFGASVDYLMGIEESEKESKLDKRLIALWDSLDDNQREIALSVVEGAVYGIKKASQDQRGPSLSVQPLSALLKS